MSSSNTLSVEVHYLQGAAQGEVEAQINLAIYYLLNDEKELAVSWLEKASAQGSLAAQYMKVITTKGYDPISIEALAEQGYAAAQNLLGDMYYERELELDDDDYDDDDEPYEEDDLFCEYPYRLKHYQHAAKWYRKAAMQGDADAQYRLGHMYAKGELEIDFVKACRFYKLAAIQGHEEALRSYGMLCYHRDFYYDNFVTFENHYLAGLNDKNRINFAVELYELAAARGSVIASLLLGQHYYLEGKKAQGSAKQQAHDKALFFVQHDYVQHFKFAALLISTIYKNGSSSHGKALEQAQTWHEKAQAINLAQALDPNADCHYGKRIKQLEDANVYVPPLQGKEIAAYVTKAVKRKSIEPLQTSLKTQFCDFEEHYRDFRCRSLERRNICLWDILEYIKWFKPAAHEGDAYAQYMLGRLYASDDPICHELARYWFEQAAKQGIAEAQEEIKLLKQDPNYRDDYEQYDYERVLRPIEQSSVYEKLKAEIQDTDMDTETD